ncbi:hypothetical protein [Alloactinosynnema sp. L-07]|uniref:hypothetical protein n=1 Tax=Alloactinosynnema sp. L-07 TaxID=1653480 RepID=UPI00065EFBCA|nr:hypothetical protein [Alloactinosynnema sp. L-07]CRK56841.1 hypothetical protein [Alloactinosynnema sp. L-07]
MSYGGRHGAGQKLDRVRDDLQRLARGLGSRHYPTEQAMTDRVTATARDRRVNTYRRSKTGTDPGHRQTNPDLVVRRDRPRGKRATDGWYALPTN